MDNKKDFRIKLKKLFPDYEMYNSRKHKLKKGDVIYIIPFVETNNPHRALYISGRKNICFTWYTSETKYEVKKSNVLIKIK